MYEVEFKVCRDLVSEDEFESLSRIVGSIFYVTDEEDEPPHSRIEVGQIYAYLLNPGPFCRDIEDCADAESGELHEAVCAVRQLPEDTIQLEIGNGFLWKPVMFVDSVRVSEEHRGRGIGKLAVLRLMDVFDRNSAILLLLAHPLESEGMGDEQVNEAQAKLIAYWKELWLIPVTEDPKSEWYGYMWHDTEYTRPTVEELTRPLESLS